MPDNTGDNISEQLDELDQLVLNGQAPDETRNFFRQHLNLPGNPFPPSGIADVSSINPPLRSATFSEILDFIRDGYRIRRSQFLVIRGDYGTGKTHILRFIEHIVNTRMNRGDHAARAIYVERPRIEAQELNRTILRSLGHDTIRKYVWFSIHTILLQDVQNSAARLQTLKQQLTALAGGGKKKGVPSPTGGLFSDATLHLPALDDVFKPETIADYRTFLARLERNGWSREDVRPYLTEVLLEALGDASFVELAQAFVALLISSDEARFSSWETLLGITNLKTVSSLRAPTFLQVLLRIMELNGIVYVYLLLDEFEEVSQGAFLSMRQRQDYLYTVREVLDKIQNGLSLVMAISPGGWDALVAEATPLADRNSRRVSLELLDVGDAVKLVQFYLDQERDDSEFKSGDLWPLSQELIAFVLDKFPVGVERTPRNVIQFFHRFLDYAAKKQITSLSQEVASTLLQEFGAVKSVRSGTSKRRRTASNADAS
jgi:hypothetical protein